MSHSPEFNEKLNAHQFGPFVIRPEVMGEMRGWASDSSWRESEDDPDFLDDLSDTDVIKGVHRNYDRGVRGFLEDQ